MKESNERAAAAFRAWRRRPNAGQPYLGVTPAGEVRIEALGLSDGDGHVVVEIYVGDPENGDPHFRVINPPTMVKDPDGSYREDPLAALAQVISDHGGATRKRKRGRK
jgi:hypothetical protein